MIDGKQRGIDRHKIDVLNEMERPKTGKAMESFLGFVNFLRDLKDLIQLSNMMLK